MFTRNRGARFACSRDVFTLFDFCLWVYLALLHLIFLFSSGEMSLTVQDLKPNKATISGLKLLGSFCPAYNFGITFSTITCLSFFDCHGFFSFFNLFCALLMNDTRRMLPESIFLFFFFIRVFISLSARPYRHPPTIQSFLSSSSYPSREQCFLCCKGALINDQLR